MQENNIREKVKELLSKPHNAIDGGLADKKCPCEFDFEQLVKGAEVELEHTDTLALALEIAMDHLTEDAKYYDHLKEMEEKHIDKSSNKEASSIASPLSYNLDRFKPGMLVEFLLKGKMVKKKVLYTDPEKGRIIVEIGGRPVGVHESQAKEVQDSGDFSEMNLPSGNFPRNFPKAKSIFNLNKTAKKKDKQKPKKKDKKSMNIFNLYKQEKTAMEGAGYYNPGAWPELEDKGKLIMENMSEKFPLSDIFGAITSGEMVEVVYDVYASAYYGNPNGVEIRKVVLEDGRDIVETINTDEMKEGIAKSYQEKEREEELYKEEENSHDSLL